MEARDIGFCFLEIKQSKPNNYRRPFATSNKISSVPADSESNNG